MRFYSTGFAFILTLMSGPAFAAVSDQGLSDADHAFLIQEAQGSEYELSIAKLAAQKASRAEVRDYAQHVVKDHESAAGTLAALMKQKGMAPVSGITPDKAAKFKELQGLNGPAFDAAYLQEAKAINAQDKQTDIKERRATEDPAVRQMVSGMVSMDTDHLETAEKLAH